jgi:hypothetical protein
MKRALLILWQLPQIIVGLLVCLISGATYRGLSIHGVRIYVSESMGWNGVSLGDRIIVGPGSAGEDEILRHEYGHVRQSRRLGPLYLLGVGLPSAAMNLLSRASLAWGSGIYSAHYYDRWPESWADRLGKVYRLAARGCRNGTKKLYKDMIKHDYYHFM